MGDARARGETRATKIGRGQFPRRRGLLRLRRRALGSVGNRLPDAAVAQDAGTRRGRSLARRRGDLQEATSVFIDMEKEKGLNRFLIDATEMVLDASLADIYNVPARQFQPECSL